MMFYINLAASLSLYDIIGVIGVIMTLYAYGALQLDRMSPKSILYSTLNAAGSALILISLYFEFNASAALIEIAWLFISLFGLYKAFSMPK